MTDKKTKAEQPAAEEKVVAKTPEKETKPAVKPKAEKAKLPEVSADVAATPTEINKRFKKPFKEQISVAKTAKPTHTDLSLRRLIDTNVALNMAHSFEKNTPLDREIKGLVNRFGWNANHKLAEIPDVIVSRFVLDDGTVLYMDDKSDYTYSVYGTKSSVLYLPNGDIGVSTRIFILVNSTIASSFPRYDTKPTSTLLINADVKDSNFVENNLIAAGIKLTDRIDRYQGWFDTDTRISVNESNLENSTVLGKSSLNQVIVMRSEIVNAKVTDPGIVKDSVVKGGIISGEYIDILNSTIEGGIKCVNRLRIHNYRNLELEYQLLVKSLNINGKTGFTHFHVGGIPPVYVIASQNGVILQRDLSARNQTDFNGASVSNIPASIEITDKDTISMESVVRRFVKQQPIGPEERSFNIERDYRSGSRDPITESLYNYLIDSVVSRIKVMFTVRAAEKLTQSHQYNANLDDCPF